MIRFPSSSRFQFCWFCSDSGQTTRGGSLPDFRKPSDPGGACHSAANPDRSGAGHSLALQLVDPLLDPGWDEAVLDHRDAGIFHSSAWARVLAGTYGHRPYYLRCRRAGRTEALVPLMEVRSRLTGCRGVCVPFADSCGPLLFPGADEAALDRSLAAMAVERGWKYLELRPDQCDDSTPVSPDPTFIAHQLDLRGTREELRAGFSASARRALRKAAQNGVTVRVSDSSEAMELFYRLHLRTRQRHGVPPQPRSFFRNIRSEIFAEGHGFVVIAEHGGCPVAAAVFLHFGTTGLYKFGASDEDSWHLRPNNPVMVEGIFTLAGRGIRRLHFGRTDPGQAGLRRFKRQWGATESPLCYRKFEPLSGQWLPIRSHSPRGAEWTHAVCRRLPGPGNRALGRLLYPHLD